MDKLDTSRVLIYDIETLKPMFMIDIFNPEDQVHTTFCINKNVNELYAFVKFAEEHKDYYWVGYNNLRFDAQVIEYILQNNQKWYDKDWREICSLIHQKALDVIDDSNYDILPHYSEEELTLPQIDLFLIWHFNNKNRMVSLKRLEFEMDFENIEELPIDMNKEDYTDDEIEKVIHYCKNDVNATYKHYLFTIGEVGHVLYKGKDKIKDREIIEQETGMKCLNWDDVKIGAEWNKLDYIKLTGKLERELWPKKVNHFYGKRYRQFFPKTAKFQTQALKNFVRRIGNTFIVNKKQNFIYKFNDELSVNIARGGLHSMEKGRMIKPGSDEMYLQCDIGSQYPNAIRKYGIYPSHLGREWNKMLVSKIERRLYYKDIFNRTKEPKYASLQEMGKLSLNGGALIKNFCI